MGCKSQKIKKARKRDIRSKRKANQAARTCKKSPKKKFGEKGPKIIRVLYQTINHFWPHFFDSLHKTVVDHRDQEKITYPFRNLTITSLLLLMTKLGSRRQVKYMFDTFCSLENINRLSDTDMEKVAHPDTLGYLFDRVCPEQMQRWRAHLVYRLIRMRALEKWRLLSSEYMIAIDGTGFIVFKKPHCEHCRKITINDKTYYRHDVLEAKLVTANGLSISLATEFIENEHENVSKQDCELNAFYRLAPRLKSYFPQLPMCLLLDGIYANQNVLKICEANSWNTITTFKKGSMPAVFAEYEALKKQCPTNRNHYEDDDVTQTFRWVNDMNHEGHTFSVLECEEVKKKTGEVTTFVWISTIRVTKSNCQKFANQGGRLRWKVENEGFNIQKNGGYNLEHAYTESTEGMKNFYFLLQIAHMINQLMEKGSLFAEDVKKLFGSLKNFAFKLLDSLRHATMSDEESQKILNGQFQIRLDSS